MSSRTLLALTVVLAVVLTASGCSSSTAPSGPVSIAGNWDFTGSFTDAEGSCQISSSVLALSQHGDSLSATFTGGTETCTIRSLRGSAPLAGVTWFRGWQISGSSVSFLPRYSPPLIGCPLKGTVSGSPPDEMSGAVHCTVYLGGKAQTSTGHWNAGLIIGQGKPAK